MMQPGFLTNRGRVRNNMDEFIAALAGASVALVGLVIGWIAGAFFPSPFL